MTRINTTSRTNNDISRHLRHKEVVVNRPQRTAPQTHAPRNSFATGGVPSAPTGTETVARAGVHRAAVARPGQAAQTTRAPQLQQAIQGGQYVRRGSRGPEVRELQTMLNRAGAHLDVDGIFGPKTQRAVRNYQSRQGIGVDGIVGPQTLGKLLGPGGSRPNQPRPVDRPNAPQPGQPAQPGASGPADARIGRVAGMENTTPEFRQKVANIADRLGMSPQHLMAVMSFETGGSFSPSERNRVSGATGLIQFMPSTARGLGTSTSELARMSPMRQLDYVEKYLKPYAGKMNTVEDAYMAVLWPAAVGKGPNHSLFSNPSIQYRQNRGLDTDGNGVVTAREAASKVRARILG